VNNLHQEMLLLLLRHDSSYAKPMKSQEIGATLKVTPSYVRGQLSLLVQKQVVGVRRGNGGGYYVIRGAEAYNDDL
jgi:DNA-binding IscR family transcriptional regulator